MRKSLVILFAFILINSFFIYGIYAQTEPTDTSAEEFQSFIDNEAELNSESSIIPEEVNFEEISDEVKTLMEEAEGFTEELSVEAGITSNSPFYFVEDKILAPFRGDLENREKKIAEMRELAPQCGQGDSKACENMKRSFERYQNYANEFERDVSPGERDEALRSSEAIRGTFIRDIAQNVDPQYKDEFVREIVLGEKNIATAAEIAGKIQELCQQLSQLDPNEYSKVCSAGRDAPDWRKKLDGDLTEEQRKEALKFGEIMSQCFETAGQECRCEDISFPDFAEACSIAAPLATACEIENNEEACEQLDDLEMPELPDYLQDIMDELEDGMNEDKYGMFFPPECEEAGATSPKECAKIMINTHAPEECRQALLDADVQNERQGREICDKIMFEKNAPQECIDAGLTDPRACGEIMFARNAPLECIEAGITGKNRDDPRECQELMMSQFGGPGGGFGPSCAPGTICGPGSQWAPGTGPNIQRSGGNCAGIQDSEERLKCYDGAGNYVQEYRGDFEKNFGDMQNQRRQCEESCRAQGEGGFIRENGNCVCEAPNYQEYRQQRPEQFRQDFDNQQPQYNPYGDFRDGQFMPPMQPGQDYNYPQPPQGMMPPGDYNYQQPPQDYQQYQQPPTTSTEPTTSGTTTTTEPAPSGTTTSEPSTSSEPAPSSSEPSPVTGGVIRNNRFLSWFWR